MADRNVVCYSFYVPEQDAQLRAFLAAQSNLSLSMRLLAKAFLANGADAGTDVSVADLGVLVRSLELGNVAEAAGVPKKGRKRTLDGAGGTGQAVMTKEEPPAGTIGEPEAAVTEEDAGEPDAAIEDEKAVVTDTEEAPVSENEETTGAEDISDSTEADDIAEEDPVSDEPDEPEDEDVSPIVSEDAHDEDADPEPDPEPAQGSGRASYNSSMNAGIPLFEGDEEDMMSLMGDV